jgi:hypothetical protein
MMDHVPWAPQADETIHHLLVGCSYSAEVWFCVLHRAGYPFLTPLQDDRHDDCWMRSRKRVSKDGRKGFDTLVVLAAREIWKERNGRVFKRSLHLVASLVSHIRDEGLLWVTAGYSSLVEFLQYRLCHQSRGLGCLALVLSYLLCFASYLLLQASASALVNCNKLFFFLMKHMPKRVLEKKYSTWARYASYST